MGFPRQNTGVGSLSLLQGTFPTQESNQGLLHCGQILYQLSYQGSLCLLSRFSHVQLFATLWAVACQAPLSTGFSRQEYCSGLPCPPPGDLPNPGIKPMSLKSPHWQAGSLPLMPPGKIQEEVKDLRINNLWNISMILGFIPLLKCKNLP